MNYYDSGNYNYHVRIKTTQVDDVVDWLRKNIDDRTQYTFLKYSIGIDILFRQEKHAVLCSLRYE